MGPRRVWSLVRRTRAVNPRFVARNSNGKEAITSNRNRTLRLTGDQKLIDGVLQHLASLPAMPVGSQMMTPADIVKLLQDRIGNGKAALKAESDQAAAVKAERDELAKTATVVSSFIRMVSGMFSASPDTLAAFGLKPRKVTPLTAEKKAAAVAKQKATRKARGTLGKKQKKTSDFRTALPALNPWRIELRAVA